MAGDAITDLDALALSRAIHAREVSCVEVMRTYLARIHRLNPRFNATVNLASDEALLAQSAERDAELARGSSRGWMHGMPQAIKDVSNAVGFPTTLGSALLKDAVARTDGIMVGRLKAAGCIVIGKTDMPEFGLGLHTQATFAGLPAISVPAGFDASGRRPMGLQLIGKPLGDAQLLALAAGYEAVAAEQLARRPCEPIDASS